MIFSSTKQITQVSRNSYPSKTAYEHFQLKVRVLAPFLKNEPGPWFCKGALGIIWYKNVKRAFWTPIASGVISVIEAAFALSELRRNNINYSTEECSDSHRFDVIISKIVVMSAYPSISGSNFRIFLYFLLRKSVFSQ